MKNKRVVLPQNKFRWLFLIGFFLILALPLLNLPPWFSPSGWGKTIVFRIILSILIFVFIWQILTDRGRTSVKLSGKVKIGLYLLLALLAIFLLATIFSLDRNFSLWGSPYRSGGFLNFSFYVIFAVLVSLILRQKDWQKLWDFSIIIAILVSIIAIFQRLGYLGEIFVLWGTRPPSTIGGPIFLAIYLLLLSFLALSFGIKERNLGKKVFYSLALSLFLFIIFLTLTRAAFIGLAFGFLYFLFFYPKRLIWLKILTALLLILGIYAFYYVNTQPEFPKYLQRWPFEEILSRFSITEDVFKNPRISGWKVSLEALKARPILGWGPENFAVGFDKYYDPSLPGIERMPGVVTTWWDRAHNFIFDIAVTAGIPALIIYLSLFGYLFWQLQKLKGGGPEKSVIYHGIQATFIGYFVANFFSFDTFSTYLIFFLLIGYSLHLISRAEQAQPGSKHIPPPQFGFRFLEKMRKWRTPILSLLFLLLVWFIWQYNIKPFRINTQINVAKFQIQNKMCEQGLARMENTLGMGRTFLDAYLRLRYADLMRQCEPEMPEKKFEFAQKGYEILKENIKIQPYYTRNWIMLGGFTNVLIEKKTDLLAQEENPEKMQRLQSEINQLAQEANTYLEKAHELSPKRQEVYLEWVKTDLVTEEYEKAREKAQTCINLNPKLGDCYWLLALSQIFLEDFDKAKENIAIAKEKGYPTESFYSLSQLGKAYTIAENYPELAVVYQKLIQQKPEEPQYHASLAETYRLLGEYEKAREEALKVLELSPESKENVEEFLKSLRQ